MRLSNSGTPSHSLSTESLFLGSVFGDPSVAEVWLKSFYSLQVFHRYKFIKPRKNGHFVILAKRGTLFSIKVDQTQEAKELRDYKDGKAFLPRGQSKIDFFYPTPQWRLASCIPLVWFSTSRRFLSPRCFPPNKDEIEAQSAKTQFREGISRNRASSKNTNQPILNLFPCSRHSISKASQPPAFLCGNIFHDLQLFPTSSFFTRHLGEPAGLTQRKESSLGQN